MLKFGTMLLRFGRVLDASDQLPDNGKPVYLYGRHALRAHPDGVKLLINHDPDRQIGRVNELFVADDVAGGRAGPWHLARAYSDEIPGWVDRPTPVSVGFTTMKTAQIRSGRILLVRAAIVFEISILTPARKPADPLAQVTLVRHGAPEVSPFAEVAARNAERRYEAEVFARAAQEAAAARGHLYRVNVGRVLSIR